MFQSEQQMSETSIASTSQFECWMFVMTNVDETWLNFYCKLHRKVQLVVPWIRVLFNLYHPSQMNWKRVLFWGKLKIKPVFFWVIIFLAYDTLWIERVDANFILKSDTKSSTSWYKASWYFYLTQHSTNVHHAVLRQFFFVKWSFLSISVEDKQHRVYFCGHT